MKKRTVVIALSALFLCAGGCSAAKQDTGSSNSDKTDVSVSDSSSVTEISQDKQAQSSEASVAKPESSVPESSTPFSEPEGSSMPESSEPSEESEEYSDEYGYPDQLYDNSFEDKPFLFFKANDHLYRMDYTTDQDKHEKEYESITPVENGELVVVKADGYTLSGGYVGYCGEPFLKRINSQEKITPQQAVEQFDIPEVGDIDGLYYSNTVLKHTIGDKLYLIFYCKDNSRREYEVYLDSQLIGTVDYEKPMEDAESDPEKRRDNLVRLVEELCAKNA